MSATHPYADASPYTCDACEDCQATRCSACNGTGWVSRRRCAECYERGPDYGFVWCAECCAAELDAGPGCRCDGTCDACAYAPTREELAEEARIEADIAAWAS